MKKLDRTSLGLAAAAALLLLAGAAEPAAAKNVDMGRISQATVQAACRRAGASPFSLENGSYGCGGANARVVCGRDGSCVGYVNDLVAVTGNSLEDILSLIRGRAGVRIQPIDARIQPMVNSSGRLVQ
jgi:hypothetical protein